MASTLPLGELAISERELAGVIKLVYERSGITLHDGKRALILARLQKRLRAGGFPSFTAYLQHVESDTSGQELVALLDAIATNHTSFYRESQHFDYLVSTVIPAWQQSGRPTLDIWSAACSTGEEPFTIAMTLLDHLPAADHGRVRIRASDMSTKALARARGAVYPLEKVRDLPMSILRTHFEKGLGAQAGTARVKPHVRRMVTFEQRNLLDPAQLGQHFDVIFCRNVMIYFDRVVQQRVVSLLERHLVPEGYLFISHSESLSAVTHALRSVAPAVFRRRT